MEVIEAVPSRLAEMLEAGELDAGLLSSVELFRQPAFGYARGVGIVADGPVESVRLFSKVPLSDVRSIALDTSSLTSVALLKLIVKGWGREVSFWSMSPNAEAMLAVADAALLIGDLGYRDYDNVVATLDLGTAWRELTGLPFVYALWIGPRVTDELSQLLVTAMEWGTARLDEIADTEAERHLTTPTRARHYYRDIMIYRLGAREDEALSLFGKRVTEEGLV